MEIKKEYFWGTMYGGKPDKCFNRITQIKVKECRLFADKSSLCYAWGWPGPDCNFYKEEDYGRTWAWELKDFEIENIKECLCND